MSKRLDKIATIEEQIARLQAQAKNEMQKHRDEERKARTKRLCSRMGLIEKLLPETIGLSDDQFEKLIFKTLASDFGKKILAELSGNSTKSEPKPSADADAKSQTAPTSGASSNSKPNNQSNHHNGSAKRSSHSKGQGNDSSSGMV